MKLEIAGLILVGAALISWFPMQAFAANSQEQVVFSGAGSGTFGPVAFWIWCKNVPGPNSHTYSTDCNGGMSFPALAITSGVTQEEGITEPSDGQYVIHVQSRNDSGHSIDCTLSNVPPVTSGPTNTVNIKCAVGTTSAGTGSSNHAVVIATGPN